MVNNFIVQTLKLIPKGALALPIPPPKADKALKRGRRLFTDLFSLNKVLVIFSRFNFKIHVNY